MIRRLQAGDAQGGDELFALNTRRLTRVAERHLSDKLAGRLDDEDVVQSVFRTFFRRSDKGAFPIDSSVTETVQRTLELLQRRLEALDTAGD